MSRSILIRLFLCISILFLVGCQKKIEKAQKNEDQIDIDKLLEKAKAESDMTQNESSKDANKTESDSQKLAKLIFDCKPFLESSPDLKYPDTIGQFFNDQIYSKMEGNFFFGYFYDEGFTFAGNNDIAIDVIKAIPQTKSYLSQFRAVLNDVVKTMGMKLNLNSHNRIGICLVSVVPQATDTSSPGMVGECYLSNSKTKKTLFLRFPMGKEEGLKQAMYCFCLRVFSLALSSKTNLANNG